MRTAKEMESYMVSRGLRGSGSKLVTSAVNRVVAELNDGEEVSACFAALYNIGKAGDKGIWAFYALTDRRLIVSEMTLAFMAATNSYSLDLLSDIHQKKPILGMRRIVVDFSRTVVEVIPVHAFDAINGILSDALYNSRKKNSPTKVEIVQPAVDAAGAPDNSPSIADEMVKLKGLLDAGILTPDEFAAAKAKLLGL